MLKKNEPHNSKIYRKSNRPPAHREISVEEAIFILPGQGYLVAAPPTVWILSINSILPAFRELGFVRSFLEWYSNYNVSTLPPL